MFFDMGPLELLVIFVVAIVVLGPEKLPKAIADVSSALRKFRSLTDRAQDEVRKELGPEFSDFQLRSLSPRALTEQALAKAEHEVGLREFKAAFSFDEPSHDPDAGPELKPAERQQDGGAPADGVADQVSKTQPVRRH